MKSKENINMKKLIPILFISSIILSGCGSKKNNTEISQTETDISSSELTTKIDDNLCALEYDTVSFETMYRNMMKKNMNFIGGKHIKADIQLLLKKSLPVIL